MIFEKKNTIDFREIRRMLWRRRLLIAIPAAVTVAAGAFGIFFMEPSYQSSATLAFENPVALTRAVEQATGQRRREGQEIQVLRKRILSSSFLETVAVQIGLHENPRIRARAEKMAKENPGHDWQDLLLRQCVKQLNRMLDIRAEGAGLFHVRAVSNSPELAFQVVKTVSESYIQSSRQGRLRQSEDAYNFAEEQAAIYEAKLEEKRRELREYEQEMALKPLTSSPVTSTNVSRVTTLIAGADADLEFLEGRHQTVRARAIEAGLEAFLGLGLMDSSKLQALKATLFELERHLALTLVEYDENEPAIISAKNQIAVKSQQLLTELEHVTALAFPSIVEEYRQLLVDYEYTLISLEAGERRKQELNDFLDRYASDLADMPATEFRLNRLQEEVESADRLYQTWLDQATSTQIAKAVQSGAVGNQLVLLEAAKLPIAPFAPDKKRIIFLSVFMGIVLGLGAAVVMEYLDLTLKSVDEIEMVLGVPILGAVPRMQATVVQEIATRRRRRLKVLVPSAITTAVALAALAYYYFFLMGNPVG